jgi:DNA-binding NarL/FixJ family response regulator
VNVFIVEDSAAMRARLAAALTELPGVRVLGWADAAAEAVREIERLRPHFVVLDLRLAQGSGLFVIEAVKRRRTPPLIAVLTSYPHEQYRVRCAELGADFFFDKAAGLDGLLDACRAAAESQISQGRERASS